MKRRTFIAGFGSVAVWPVAAQRRVSIIKGHCAPAFAGVGDWCIVQG